MASQFNSISKTHCLIPVNKIYSSKRDFINGLEKKVRFALGPNWKIFSKIQFEFEGSYTLIDIISPENIRISNYFELMKFCELKQICKKKVKFISFKLWNFKSTLESWDDSDTFIAVEIVQTAMKRTLKQLRAKKQILSQL